MTRYSKGRNLEYRTMERLKAEGYWCVRSAGSKGHWDIVAIGAKNIRLVQVKANRWPGKVELTALRADKAPAGVLKQVWRWDDRERQPKIGIIG